jgi:hypothetical protein
LSLLERILLVLVGVCATAVVGAVGWLWKRTFARTDDKREFLRTRMEQRDKGFTHFLAACDLMQFLKADKYLASVLSTEPKDSSSLLVQATAAYHTGIDLISANVGDRQPFQEVLNYFSWVFLDDHPPGRTPGPEEYERIHELVVRCQRVCQELDNTMLTRDVYRLDQSHEFQEMQRLANASGSRLLVDDNGTISLPLTGEAMAEWIENTPRRLERWKWSRSITLELARRSGLFRDLPE